MCLKMATFLFFEWLCQKLTDFNVFLTTWNNNGHFLRHCVVDFIAVIYLSSKMAKSWKSKELFKTKKLAIFWGTV